MGSGDTKVLVVDHSPTMRAALRHVIASVPETRVVGEAATRQTAERAVSLLRPDVVLLDAWLAGESGLLLLRQVKRRRPAPSVIVVTDHLGSAFRRMCLELGADFFIDRTDFADRIPDVLSRLRAGAAPLQAVQRRVGRRVHGVRVLDGNLREWLWPAKDGNEDETLPRSA